MKPEDHTYWQIEDYLAGRLMEDELLAFRNRLEQDPQLKQEVESHKLARELLIRSRLNRASEASLKMQKETGRQNFLKKLIAGCTLLILAAGGFYLLNPEGRETEPVSETRAEKIVKKDTIQESVYRNEEQTVPQTKKQVRHSAPASPAANKVSPVQLPSYDTSVKDSFRQPVSQPSVKQAEKEPEKGPEVKTRPDPAVNSCHNIMLTAHTQVTPACRNQHNGSIFVSGFRGGTAPYHVEIVRVESGEHFSASALSPGTYHVLLTDARQCTGRIENVPVKEVTCGEEKAFNPFLGEVLELEEYSSAGRLTIRDKSGHVLYTALIPAGERPVWNGTTQNGQVSTGYFTYEVLYGDGTSANGSVTVTQ